MIVSDYDNGHFKSDLLENYNKFKQYLISHNISWDQVMKSDVNIQISADVATLAELRKQLDKYYSNLTADQKTSFDKCWAMLGQSKSFSWEDDAFQLYSTTVYLMKNAPSEQQLMQTLADLDQQRQLYNSMHTTKTMTDKMNKNTLDELLNMDVMTPNVDLQNITDLQQLDYNYRTNIYMVAKLVDVNPLFELRTIDDLVILRNKCNQDWSDMAKIDPAGLVQSNMDKCKNVQNADFLVLWRKTANGYKFYLEDRVKLIDFNKSDNLES